MKKIEIYQLPTEHKAKFMGLEFVTENGIMPKFTDYKRVCVFETWDKTTLDDIYQKFNIGERPENFTGHSLSVSDLVKMDGKFYYCDDYGWEEVDIEKLVDLFQEFVEAYNDYYDNGEVGDYADMYKLGCQLIDDENMVPLLSDFARYRQDYIISDREVAAFGRAYTKLYA